MKRLINKKGMVIELIALIVVAFIALVFFSLWNYGINQVDDIIKAVPNQNVYANVTYAAQNTFSHYSDAMGQLEFIAYIIIFAFALSTLIIAFYTRNHPMMLFVYILILVVLAIFSFYISNAYESLLSGSGVLATSLAGYTIGNYIMLNMPIWIIAIGCIGIILMVAIIVKEQR